MSAHSQRPHTLLEVSRRVIAQEQGFDPAIREFLDEFYANPASHDASMAQRPMHIDDVKDAYLAAVAEHLASSHNRSRPSWTDPHGTPLTIPFFAGGLESLKAILTVQSPAAFRRRMLFVSHDALDRPRQPRVVGAVGIEPTTR